MTNHFELQFSKYRKDMIQSNNLFHLHLLQLHNLKLWHYFCRIYILILELVNMSHNKRSCQQIILQQWQTILCIYLKIHFLKTSQKVMRLMTLLNLQKLVSLFSHIKQDNKQMRLQHLRTIRQLQFIPHLMNCLYKKIFIYYFLFQNCIQIFWRLNIWQIRFRQQRQNQKISWMILCKSLKSHVVYIFILRLNSSIFLFLSVLFDKLFQYNQKVVPLIFVTIQQANRKQNPETSQLF